MKNQQANPYAIGASWLIALSMYLAPAPALAGQNQTSVGSEAKNAATRPLQDLNLAGEDAPAELLLLQDNPYSTDGLTDCGALDRQIAGLDDILGPDVDVPREQAGMFRTALKTGGSILTSFVPFRGMVRQISGANAKQKRLEDAIVVGIARRSFLKGFAASLECPTAEERAIQAAREGLSME